MPTPLAGGLENSFAPQMIFLWPPARGVGKQIIFVPDATLIIVQQVTRGGVMASVKLMFKLELGLVNMLLFVLLSLTHLVPNDAFSFPRQHNDNQVNEQNQRSRSKNYFSGSSQLR